MTRAAAPDAPVADGFDADWLALRAPADAAARDKALEATLRDWVGDAAITIADIGGGSGAAMRALGPKLPRARWRLYDNDPALLARAPEGAETHVVDLAADLDAIFAAPPSLITAFAFLDLVSADWLARLAARAAAEQVALYATLIYDGRETWRPAPPHEAAAHAAFTAHMRTDKGFGPALGPDAPMAATAAFTAEGFLVLAADSPWRLTEGPLLTELARGAAEAVRPALAPDAYAPWRAARLAAASATIGHKDVLALPRAR